MSYCDRTNNIKKDFPEILKQHMGIISSACKAAGINRATYYAWRDKDAVFKEACMEAYEERKDFAESILLKKIKDEDTACVLFYLKTQAKDRGYVERVESTGKDGGPIKSEQDLSDAQRALFEFGVQRLREEAVSDYKATVEQSSGN